MFIVKFIFHKDIMRGTYKSEVNIIISISGFWKDSNQIRKLINDSAKCKYRLTENYLFHEDDIDEFVFHLDNSALSLTKPPTPTDFNQLKKKDENNINQHE